MVAESESGTDGLAAWIWAEAHRPRCRLHVKGSRLWTDRGHQLLHASLLFHPTPVPWAEVSECPGAETETPCCCLRQTLSQGFTKSRSSLSIDWHLPGLQDYSGLDLHSFHILQSLPSNVAWPLLKSNQEYPNELMEISLSFFLLRSSLFDSHSSKIETSASECL